MPRTYRFPPMSGADAQVTKTELEGLGDGVVVEIVPDGASKYVLTATYPEKPGTGAPAKPADLPPATAPGSPARAILPLEARSAPIPPDDPTPKARAPADSPPFYWPVVTDNPDWNEINYTEIGTNRHVGSRTGRAFYAVRSGGQRHHVAIDLFGSAGDVVVAIAGGRIVDFYAFYKAGNGIETFALIVAHDNFVANYGEVDGLSLSRLGLKKGDAVAAGQPIGQVGASAMLHFETYVPGTTHNFRWMVGQPRPAATLDPTDLLLWLADNGTRLKPGAPAIPPANLPSVASYTGPRPGAGGWSSAGGRSWAWDRNGVSIRDAAGLASVAKYADNSQVCKTIWNLYANLILAAAVKHDVNPALIIMTIATESAAQIGDGFTGPSTFRWEAGPSNTDVLKPFKGTYSAGPMQCLATTVRDLIKRVGTPYGLAYQMFDVAPAIASKPQAAPAALALYDPATNIDLGTAEIRERKSLTHDDPIRVAAAYNAGGLYSNPANPWGLRVAGDHLDRAAGWYGDACAVLAEHGLL